MIMAMEDTKNHKWPTGANREGPRRREGNPLVPVLDEIDIDSLDPYLGIILKFEAGRITREDATKILDENLSGRNNSGHTERVGVHDNILEARRKLLETGRIEIEKRLSGDRASYIGIIDFDRVPDEDIDILLKLERNEITKQEYLSWVNSVYRETRLAAINRIVGDDERLLYLYWTLHPRYRFTQFLDTAFYWRFQ